MIVLKIGVKHVGSLHIGGVVYGHTYNPSRA